MLNLFYYLFLTSNEFFLFLLGLLEIFSNLFQSITLSNRLTINIFAGSLLISLITILNNIIIFNLFLSLILNIIFLNFILIFFIIFFFFEIGILFIQLLIFLILYSIYSNFIGGDVYISTGIIINRYSIQLFSPNQTYQKDKFGNIYKRGLIIIFPFYHNNTFFVCGLILA